MESSDLQHQATATHLLEEVFACSSMLTTLPPQPQPQAQQQQQQEKRSRPQPEQALRCPRCDSTNTKFCYYNNYSLSQPRYFCKGCRRYWTKGGTLRNVPVGGSCRKNKRPSSSKKAHDHHSLAAATNAVLQSLPPPPPPPLTYDPNDLTLAFAGLQKPPTARQLGLDDRDPFMLESATANPIPPPQMPGFLDILRSGFLDSSAGLYYGLGGQGTTQEVEGGGEQVVVPPFEGLGGATVTIKQENSYRSVGDDSKLFMGLQWQVAGEGNTNHMMVDPGRAYWNGVGLVHSSLI